jgi:thiol-disulfide isomerase/thioredoxin
MKLLLIALLVMIASINLANASEKQPLQYKDIVANNVGNVVYLDFWASWCVPCRRSFPWMNEMQKKYGNKNFKVISINVDTEKNLAEEFLVKNPANFSILYDPDGILASEMKLKGMPSSFIINADGEVVNAHVGFTDKKKAFYEQEIQQLIQGK